MRTTIFDKPKRLEKLSKHQRESLVFDLVNALVVSRNFSEAALFLADLLTKAEMRILGKRLRIAKLLLEGKTYEEIEKNLHTSHTTVAKIAAWLSERGDGFRKIVQKLPKPTEVKSWMEYSEWDTYKRSHSLYFWPELLLEEIIKNANTRQKAKIENVLNQLEEKSELHRRIEQLLHKV